MIVLMNKTAVIRCVRSLKCKIKTIKAVENLIIFSMFDFEGFFLLQKTEDEEDTSHYWMKWPSLWDMWHTWTNVLMSEKQTVNMFHSTSPAHRCAYSISSWNCLIQTTVQNNFCKTYFWYWSRYNWRHCLHWFMGEVGIWFYSYISYQTTNSESNNITLICWSVMNVHGFMVRIMQ